eukprot:16451-Heterococcus_DN1.PRE.2
MVHTTAPTTPTLSLASALKATDAPEGDVASKGPAVVVPAVTVGSVVSPATVECRHRDASDAVDTDASEMSARRVK